MEVDDNNECIHQSEQLPLILALQVDQVRRALMPFEEDTRTGTGRTVYNSTQRGLTVDRNNVKETLKQ